MSGPGGHGNVYYKRIPGDQVYLGCHMEAKDYLPIWLASLAEKDHIVLRWSDPNSLIRLMFRATNNGGVWNRALAFKQRKNNVGEAQWN